MKKLNVAILGTGKLGTDLLIKVLRSPHLSCVGFVGRNRDSKGIALAKELKIPVSTEGISFLEANPSTYDLVFDVTTADSHLLHWPILEKLGKRVIDLTPSHVGKMVVPTINLAAATEYENISLISCGGQASLPIVDVLRKNCRAIESLEIVSSIASKSAGPGTRINIDEYVEQTELALSHFSQCPQVKSILILNPAEPEINMKTTIYAKSAPTDLASLEKEVRQTVKKVQSYIPGYEMTVGPHLDQGTISISIQVKGRGDFLPAYAGNLDIINCAAIQIGESLALHATEGSLVYAD